MSKSIFTKQELSSLAALALIALLAFASGLDGWLAETASGRSSLGISLFFSFWYFLGFEAIGFVALWRLDRKTFASAAVSLVLLAIFRSVIASLFFRPRPPQAMPIGDDLLALIFLFQAKSSFFSGHAAAAISIWTAMMQSRIRPKLGFIAALPILSSRLTLVHHYLSDVLAGAMFGYVLTKVVMCLLASPVVDRKSSQWRALKPG